MDKQDVVKHFEEMTESKTWTRRSLLSSLGRDAFWPWAAGA